ncbi:hypothetical protein F895_01827 [Acinetobacter sp. CIP 64.2]|uniref:hypothetical protein n=1 Tax=unclassified Acinetobacter TaxID=196816 RepID=UPI000287AA80|nr:MULTISPECIES: hypothetical protein [unclassified Acinetobacter]ENX15281.1 hypothetical protein F895_01827 [Acinetobacter sp. CIP 64.2]
MKIKFYWYFDDVEQHKLMPAVEIKCVDEKTINCLQGVLTDDAGINSITWLEKGVEIFKEVENSCNSTIWDRDAWGSEYTDGRVKLYSLYDDEYYIYLSLDSFRDILNAWVDFNRAPPDLESYIYLEI